MATYDLSDLGAPRQVAKQVFAGANSEVEQDHKAFLHWPEEGLAVVPIDQWSQQGAGFHAQWGWTSTRLVR